jgi:hypothetical protein
MDTVIILGKFLPGIELIKGNYAPLPVVATTLT